MALERAEAYKNFLIYVFARFSIFLRKHIHPDNHERKETKYGLHGMDEEQLFPLHGSGKT